MAHSAALPFVLRRSHDVVGWEVTSTRETVHGLVRLEGDRVFIQWRVARSIDHVGMQIRTDKEVEPVREVVIPLGAVAGAAGLSLEHPAELALRLRGADRTLGSEFAGELELALAERALAAAEGKPQLASPPTPPDGA
jgi:hypothetical protein